MKWLGLEAAPPEPDSWATVVRDLQFDERPRPSSLLADQIVAALENAGITAHQRAYEFYNVTRGGRVPRTEMQRRIAVVVHARDLGHAVEVAHAEQDKTTSTAERSEAPPRVSDGELTRQSLAAGRLPPD